MKFPSLLDIDNSNASESGMNRRYLHPGETVITSDRCHITTILGSCVAFVLRDEQRGMTGMAHYILPSSEAGRPGTSRYGDIALEYLLMQMQTAGCRISNMTAQIYGGAAVLVTKTASGGIGERNVAFAENFASKYGILVVARDTAGFKGRRVVVDTRNGSATVKVL